MVEMIGVLAVMAILAAMLLPNMVRKLAEAKSTKEDRNLQSLAQGLLEYVRTRQIIPGSTAWATNIAEMTGLNVIEILRVTTTDTNSARVFIVHPAFTPSTGSNPIYTNASAGASAPSEARLMIVSTTKSSLALPITSGKASNTAPNRQAFQDVWDWNYDPTTKAPPSGWPAAWNNNGEHLHVQRINLAPLFYHVTVSNTQFPTNIPFAKFDNLSPIAFDVTNAVDAYYIHGTSVRLYKHDTPYVGAPANPDQLDLTHSVQCDVNFFYTGYPVQWIIP